MMLTIADKQKLFGRLYPLLVLKAQQLGFEVVFGETHRPEYQAAENERLGVGTNPSCHMWCLAGDINLFRHGTYLTESDDYEELGVWWEQQHELCRWGGRFKDRVGNPAPDGGHFSITHRGVS